ncbi:MAG: hypothetical protein GDA38_22875 [Hormoscilla sp. SP12CHS1]|nr:hypothetical protein [Hormoscilla sp. SP12CHS1]
MYVEDLDADGKDEILVHKKSPKGDQSSIMRVLSLNDDGENFTEALLPSAPQVYGQRGQLYIADYKGNGQNYDILVQRSGNDHGLLYSVTLGSNDHFQGEAENDTLSGGNGRDGLYGYGGNDSLLGDNGSDPSMAELKMISSTEVRDTTCFTAMRAVILLSWPRTWAGIPSATLRMARTLSS